MFFVTLTLFTGFLTAFFTRLFSAFFSWLLTALFARGFEAWLFTRSLEAWLFTTLFARCFEARFYATFFAWRLVTWLLAGFETRFYALLARVETLLRFRSIFHATLVTIATATSDARRILRPFVARLLNLGRKSRFFELRRRFHP